MKRIAVLVALLALGIPEVYMLTASAPGRVAVPRGAHETRVRELAAGAAIAQSFRAAADGLYEFRFLTDAASAGDGDLSWKLFEDVKGAWQPVLGTHRTVAIATGVHWQILRFPALEHSAGRTYRVEFRYRPRQPSEVSLVASLDDVHRGGFLTVDGREQWGDLVFEARAVADTAAGRFVTQVAPGLPSYAASAALWTALLVLLTIAVAAIAGAAIAGVPSSFAGVRARSRLGSAALIVVLAAALVETVRARPTPPADIDLLDRLSSATFEPSPAGLHFTFQLMDQTVGGVSLPALFAHTRSRIAWSVTVPAGAHFRTSLGIVPTAWSFPVSDGVVFRVSVADGGRETELLMRHVDPAHVEEDRRWIPVDVDLAAFAGRTVQIRLATEPSLPGAPENGAYDWALWGAPTIAIPRSPSATSP